MVVPQVIGYPAKIEKITNQSAVFSLKQLLSRSIPHWRKQIFFLIIFHVKSF